MEVYKSKYWSIYYDEVHKMLNPDWDEKSSELTDLLYKQEMEQYTQIVEKYRPGKALINCMKMFYVIPIDVQEWTNKNLFPRILAAGVNKVAIILPADIITQLSLEQVMEESMGVKFTTKYFSDSQIAKDWLIS